MQVQSLQNQLDGLFQRGEFDKVEPFMLGHIAQAEADDDKASVLSLLNELMGYYRSRSRFSDALSAATKALALLKEMGLKGSLSYATTLLNIATTWRATDKLRESIELFEQVGRLFLALKIDDAVLVATLYNNLAMAWQELGDHDKAVAFLEAALPLSRSRPGAEHDVAVSLTNLALSRIRLQQLAQARTELEEAVRLFDALARPSGHASAAIAALAELCFREGRAPESVQLYERALADIAARYGHNAAYADTLASLALVLETLDAARSAQLAEEAQALSESLKPRPMQGLALARSYYQAMRNTLLTNYAEQAGRIAAGLVGRGSECFGFDDEQSRDHDFGPGFCLWLTDADYAAIGAQLQAAYDRLPKEFAGHAARQASPRSGQRVGVFRSSDFLSEFLGAPALPISDADWLQIPENLLACACNGEVFDDPAGEFSRLRSALQAYYPASVRRRKLAQAVAHMAQSGQYNLPRALARDEPVAAFLAQAEFISQTCAAIHVLNRRYLPPAKWAHRSVRHMPRLNSLYEPLASLAHTAVAQAPALIEEICGQVLQELIAQGFSQAGEAFLETHVDAILGAQLPG